MRSSITFIALKRFSRQILRIAKHQALWLMPAITAVFCLGALTLSIAEDNGIALLGLKNNRTPLTLVVPANTANKADEVEIQVTPYLKSEDTSVFVNHQEVIHYRTRRGTLTPYERATKTAKKLHEQLLKNTDPNQIEVACENNKSVITRNKVTCENNKSIITLDKVTLSTIDFKSAEASKNTPQQLALIWANLTRKALGGQEIILKTTETEAFQPTDKLSMGRFKQHGQASWYGPQFHGRTAANGSIYNMYEYTAAHKKLPFGTIVKVTNKRNNKSVVVKITDRGPFISGRIIDLSKAAAQDIGMSGVAPVVIQTVTKITKTVNKPTIQTNEEKLPLVIPAKSTVTEGPVPTKAVAPSIELRHATEPVISAPAVVDPNPINDPKHEHQVPVSFLDNPVAAASVSKSTLNQPINPPINPPEPTEDSIIPEPVDLP